MEKRMSKANKTKLSIKEREADGGSVLVVRIRGRSTTHHRAERTLLLFNLSRVHHAALLPNNIQVRGMIEEAVDYITFGKPSLKTVEDLVSKVGKTEQGDALTEDYLKKAKVAASMKEFAAELHSGKLVLSHVKSVKPIFRLKPAKGGFGSIKAKYPKGALGKRDTAGIDKLVEAMLK